MPHFTIEYSANLDAKIDIAGLCDAIRRAALATGLFEIGAVRVRAVRCEAYAIADALDENAFVDLSIKIGQGRSLEERQKAGSAIFEALKAILAPLFETPHFALSMEMREIDAETSWKQNAIHPRLRNRQGAAT